MYVYIGNGAGIGIARVWEGYNEEFELMYGQPEILEASSPERFYYTYDCGTEEEEGGFCLCV